MKGRSFRMMLLALATVFMVAGCGGDNSDKVSNPDGAVAFAIHEQSDGVPGKLLNDVKAKSEGAGWQFVNEIAGGNANLQLDQVNKMVDDKAAAIVVIAQNGDSIVPAVKRANEAGIPVIATNRDINGGVFTNVVNNERQAGELQADYMAAHLPQNAKVVYIKGDMTISAAVNRYEGFKEAIKAKRPDVEIIASNSTGDWSEAQGIRELSLWLGMYPQIDGVAAANDYMAMGAIKAMKAAGRFNESVIVCGVDSIDDALASIAAGELKMTVKQDANKIVETIMGLLQQIKQGQSPEKGDVLVPMIAITKDNLSQYK
ncbi:sugar ABC transporter substrate-binding protein [Anaerovibrio lipolyticus]|uniref:sugar ABC transporter substrate-binding protein n=1 Tax=Anaerovibrio lipolyticus TaxID=82374 RepID=UPI001F2BA9FB|nr:sugar ABC transporter substrate-binding protein [Anaerovibrio lipolyticus]MCF2601667.1 sugar ABC transporter substrate-binding protein [Anaerovibrio lipolyticus]